MSVARVSAILAVIFVAASAWIILTPASQVLGEGTNHAQEIDFLFKFMLVASVPIFLIVQGFLLYFVLRYRRKPGEDPEALGANIHGNTRLEIIWSVIPALFLVVLTGMSYKVYADIITRPPTTGPSGAYTLTALAYQFGWSCEHTAYKTAQAPQGLREDTTCHLPYNRNIILNLQTNDVLHSFWVPEFRVKQDAVPGYATRMYFKTIQASPLPDGLPADYYRMVGQSVPKPGEHRAAGSFRLVCSELCGYNHAYMVAKVYVWPQPMFDAWARSQIQAQSGSNLASVTFSKDIQPLLTAHCQACHILAQSGGLSLASYQGLLKGGNIVLGAVFKPGDHAHSVIWQITQPTPPWPGGNRMPLGGPYLSDLQIKTIAAWIDQGAKNN